MARPDAWTFLVVAALVSIVAGSSGVSCGTDLPSQSVSASRPGLAATSLTTGWSPATKTSEAPAFPDSLRGYLGRPVVVFLWKSQCGPCRKEKPDLDKFYREASAAINIVTVVEEKRSDAEDYLQTNEFASPVIFDEAFRVAAYYRVNMVPALLVLDSKGAVLVKHEGRVSFEELRQLVKGSY